ncbi:MAG: methyltransferase domain-containing protein [Steroidobacteraceae bacterium]
MSALVVSPDAAVRFLRGQAVLHNAHFPAAPLLTTDADVLAVLLKFASPADPADLRLALRPDRRADFDKLIDALTDAGLLVDIQATGEARSAEVRAALLQRQLGLLANATAEVAADLAALGPAVLPGADAPLAGLGLEHRIEALLGAVDALRQGVAAVREPLVQQQLDALRARGLLDELKLHIGSGAGRLPGWVNVDIFPAELSINVNRPLPFPHASAHLVFASHVLEHLYYPAEALRFLGECCRVLASGGRIRLIVPDIERYIRAYATHDERFFAVRRKTWRRLPVGRTLLEEFLSYAGVGPDPAAFLEAHKYGYDFETLAKALRQAGFHNVTQSSFDGSAVPELRVDAASDVAHAAMDGHHYSLFVEAEVP